MRVLLIQSALGRKGVSDQLVFPIGLCCIATALENAGHEPKIIDLNVFSSPMAELKKEIISFNPDIIGVSQRNLDSTTRKAPFVYHTILKPTLEAIKEANQNLKTIIGGPGFTQAAKTLMERYDFDFGVMAEGEQSIVELLENLDSPEKVTGIFYKKHGEVLFTGNRELPDLAEMPFPKRHYVDWNLYRKMEQELGLKLDVGVETTRGCPRRCAYCNYPKLNGTKIRIKPPKVVVDELEYLNTQFGVDTVTFTDSRFNEPKSQAIAICNEIINRNLKMRWIAWLGFEGIDADFLGLMRKAGCFRVAFSPDGLLKPSLDRMLKDSTTKHIANTVKAVGAVKGLKASWSFFAVPPSTSRREQLAMIAYYAWIHASLLGRGRMTLTWCRVEEGTYFHTIALEDGVIGPGVELLPDDPQDLDKLFYIPPGFEKWSDRWDKLLDIEMEARAKLGQVTRPLRRFGFRDLTPGHMKGKKP